MSETGALLVRQTERIAELTRELSAAQKDAERYRWLRNNATDIKFSGRHVIRMTMNCLNASIDAAIAAEKSNPSA